MLVARTMGDSYQGGPAIGPKGFQLTPGEILSIAGAALGRRRIGGVQPGYALRPLGGVLMGHEEAGRTASEEARKGGVFAKSMEGIGGLTPMQKALMETPYGREVLAKQLSQKTSTYGQPVSPEREAQEIRVHQAEAKVPNWKDPEYLKQRADEWERRRREQEGFQVSQAKRREAVLEARGGGKTPPLYQDKEGVMYLFDARSRQFMRQDEAGKWAPTNAIPKGLTKAGSSAGGGGAVTARYYDAMIADAPDVAQTIKAVWTMPFETVGPFQPEDVGGGAFSAGAGRYLQQEMTPESKQRFMAVMQNLGQTLGRVISFGSPMGVVEMAKDLDKAVAQPGMTAGTAQVLVANWANRTRNALHGMREGILDTNQKEIRTGVLDELKDIPNPSDLQKQYYEGTKEPALGKTPAATSTGGTFVPGKQESLKPPDKMTDEELRAHIGQ